jgi:hypothetical protein
MFDYNYEDRLTMGKVCVVPVMKFHYIFDILITIWYTLKSNLNKIIMYSYECIQKKSIASENYKFVFEFTNIVSHITSQILVIIYLIF